MKTALSDQLNNQESNQYNYEEERRIFEIKNPVTLHIRKTGLQEPSRCVYARNLCSNRHWKHREYQNQTLWEGDLPKNSNMS